MPLSALQQHQAKFLGLWAEFLPQAVALAKAAGLELVHGDAWRSPEEADRLARLGYGSRRSLHCLRLACDLQLLDADGKPVSDSAAYRPLGEAWEALGGSWGGRFLSPFDPYHFSLAWEGRK